MKFKSYIWVPDDSNSFYKGQITIFKSLWILTFTVLVSKLQWGYKYTNIHIYTTSHTDGWKRPKFKDSTDNIIAFCYFNVKIKRRKYCIMLEENINVVFCIIFTFNQPVIEKQFFYLWKNTVQKL